MYAWAITPHVNQTVLPRGTKFRSPRTKLFTRPKFVHIDMVSANTNFGGYFMEHSILYNHLPVVRVRYFNLIVSATTVSPICISTSTTLLQVQLWPLRSHLESTSCFRCCGSWYCSSISFSLWYSTPSFMPSVYQSTTGSSSLKRCFSVSVSASEINFFRS